MSSQFLRETRLCVKVYRVYGLSVVAVNCLHNYSSLYFRFSLPEYILQRSTTGLNQKKKPLNCHLTVSGQNEAVCKGRYRIASEVSRGM